MTLWRAPLCGKMRPLRRGRAGRREAGRAERATGASSAPPPKPRPTSAASRMRAQRRVHEHAADGCSGAARRQAIASDTRARLRRQARASVRTWRSRVRGRGGPQCARRQLRDNAAASRARLRGVAGRPQRPGADPRRRRGDASVAEGLHACAAAASADEQPGWQRAAPQPLSARTVADRCLASTPLLPLPACCGRLRAPLVVSRRPARGPTPSAAAPALTRAATASPQAQRCGARAGGDAAPARGAPSCLAAAPARQALRRLTRRRAPASGLRCCLRLAPRGRARAAYGAPRHCAAPSCNAPRRRCAAARVLF